VQQNRKFENPLPGKRQGIIKRHYAMKGKGKQTPNASNVNDVEIIHSFSDLRKCDVDEFEKDKIKINTLTAEFASKGVSASDEQSRVKALRLTRKRRIFFNEWLRSDNKYIFYSDLHIELQKLLSSAIDQTNQVEELLTNMMSNNRTSRNNLESIDQIISEKMSINKLKSFLLAAGIVDENENDNGKPSEYIAGVVDGLINENKINGSRLPAVKILFKHIGRQGNPRTRSTGNSYTEGKNFTTNYFISH
jgi:hypothetical protein